MEYSRNGHTYTNRAARADAIGFFTDSAAYFAALADVIPKARRRLILVGWSFDDRVVLRRDGRNGDRNLGEIILEAARQNRALEIVIAIWNPPSFFAADQHISADFLSAIEQVENITLHRVAQDSAFRSLHKKFIILDDELLFVGGIDISRNRWDTPDHRSDNSLRRNPGGERYVPYHDVQAVMSGEVAEAFYRQAIADGTLPGDGTAPSVESTVPSLWPRDVDIAGRNVPVGIAETTVRSEDGDDEMGEIGDLYLRMIDEAKEFIYIENQYFSSDDVTGALIRRLEEGDGPEVVIVVPRELPDVVGKWTMGINSMHHIAVLRRHDRHNRLFVCNPVAPDDPSVAVKVHSKLMIIDGRLITLGSANISRRSFFLDLETNVVIDAAATADGEWVQQLEDRLMAQHCALSPEEWRDRRERYGGSRLEAFRSRAEEWSGIREHTTGEVIGALPADFLKKFDMNRPPPQEQVLQQIARIDSAGIVRRIRQNWLLLTALAAVIGAAFLLSRYEVDIDQILDRLSSLNSSRPVLAAAGTILAYWLSMAVFVSIVVPIVFFAALHGPWWGMVYSVIGLFSGAAIYYGLGILLHRNRWLERFSVVRVGKKQLEKIRPYGLWAVAISRMVPSGPFMVVNIVTGMIGFTPRQFLAGSAIGLMPGIVALSFFGDIIRDVFTDPTPLRVLLFLLFIALYSGAVRLIIGGIRRIAGRNGASR